MSSSAEEVGVQKLSAADMAGIARQAKHIIIRCVCCGSGSRLSECEFTEMLGPSCCFQDCPKPAEWIVYVAGEHPADGCTEACTAHVGELLTDAGEHRIYPIGVAYLLGEPSSPASPPALKVAP